MPRAKSTAALIARTSGVMSVDGSRYFFRKGQPYSADHPLVRTHPELFEAFAPVEQATAAPGERRQYSRNAA